MISWQILDSIMFLHHSADMCESVCHADVLTYMSGQQHSANNRLILECRLFALSSILPPSSCLQVSTVMSQTKAEGKWQDNRTWHG